MGVEAKKKKKKRKENNKNKAQMNAFFKFINPWESWMKF